MPIEADKEWKIKDMIFVLPFSLLLLVLNIIRIVRIPITHDETGYRADGGYLDLIFPKIASANNHILHSLIRKFFVENVSDTLFFIRIDSLAAQVMFLVFSCLLCKKLFKPQLWVCLAFFIFNIVSPFLFDFWGLSRGYALGLALMTGSIYYLISYHTSGRLSLLAGAFIAGALTVYANFGFINYYMSLCGVVFLGRFLFADGLYTKRSFGKEMLVLFSVSGVLAALITHNLIVLQGGGELTFLGNNGFVQDTVKSLVDWNLYIPNKDDRWGPWIRHAAVYSVYICMVYWLVVFITNKRARKQLAISARYSVMLLLLLLIPVVAVIAQNKLLGITYLVDRTALFFILLFIFNATYFIYHVGRPIPKISMAVGMCMALVLGGNFFYNIEMRSTRLWWYDAGDMVILKKIDRLTQDKTGKILLRVNGYHLPAIKYDVAHFYKNRYQDIEEVNENLPQDTLADYYFLWASEGDKLPKVYHADTSVCGGACVLYRKH